MYSDVTSWRSRVIALVFALVSIPAVLFAGGGSEESGAATARTEVDLLFRAGNRVELFTRVTDAFNDSQNSYYIELIPSTGQEDLTARIASGNTPDMTTQINGRALRPYVEAGLLMDIKDEAFLDKILPSELDASRVGDGIYALPMDTQAWGMFYNKTLFADAGVTVPRTVTEFKRMVDGLKAAGITPFAVGFATPWTIGQYFGYATSSAFTPAASADLDSYMAGDFSFRSVPEIDAIMEIFDLIATNTQSRPMDSEISTQYVTFASEQAAIMPQGIWSILQIRELNPDLEMGIFPVPLTENPADVRFPTQYGFVLNIFESTQKMDALRAYIEFYLDQDGPGGFYYDEIGVPSANATADPPLDPAADLLAEYIARGDTVMTYHMLMPAGFQVETFSLVSEYLATDVGNHDGFLRKLDEALRVFSRREMGIDN